MSPKMPITLPRNSCGRRVSNFTSKQSWKGRPLSIRHGRRASARGDRAVNDPRRTPHRNDPAHARPAWRKVKLREWPTTVKPFCKSKGRYQELPGERVEALSLRCDFSGDVLCRQGGRHPARQVLGQSARLRGFQINRAYLAQLEPCRHQDFVTGAAAGTPAFFKSVIIGHQFVNDD